MIPVASIELNKTELLLLPKAFTQLTVTIQPWYATNKNLKDELMAEAIDDSIFVTKKELLISLIV